jgi:hypothetical protein
MTGGLFNGQLLYPPLRNAIMDWISTKGSCHASAEILERLGIESTGPPKRCRSNGELDYVYDV